MLVKVVGGGLRNQITAKYPNKCCWLIFAVDLGILRIEVETSVQKQIDEESVKKEGGGVSVGVAVVLMMMTMMVVMVVVVEEDVRRIVKESFVVWLNRRHSNRCNDNKPRDRARRDAT